MYRFESRRLSLRVLNTPKCKKNNLWIPRRWLYVEVANVWSIRKRNLQSGKKLSKDSWDYSWRRRTNRRNCLLLSKKSLPLRPLVYHSQRAFIWLRVSVAATKAGIDLVWKSLCVSFINFLEYQVLNWFTNWQDPHLTFLAPIGNWSSTLQLWQFCLSTFGGGTLLTD